jgi:hypothetical protein
MSSSSRRWSARTGPERARPSQPCIAWVINPARTPQSGQDCGDLGAGSLGGGRQVEPVRPARIRRTVRHAAPLGAAGVAWSRQPSSAGVRSPLVWLHRAQAATTFSQACRPPRLRGMTWSIVSAGALQYWHRQPSRAKIARRDRPTCARYGTRTNRVNRTTLGTGSWCRALCRIPSPSATQMAFAERTRIAARRTDTTHSGSYVALRTNADEPAVGRMSGIALTSGRSCRSRHVVRAVAADEVGRVRITGARGPIVPDR